VKGISQAVLGSSDQLEGTSQPVTIFKKLKNPSSPFRKEKDLRVQALWRFLTCFFGLPASTRLGHRSQITIGPVLRPFSYTKSTWISLGFSNNPNSHFM
jgi:hypothetical protein